MSPGVAGWDDLHEDVVVGVKDIHGLSAEDQLEVETKIKTALNAETDKVKQKALALKLKATVEAVAKGGIKAGLLGFLGL